MTVKCKYCAARITLNVDSEEARATGSDPHQQLRKHMVSHPILAIHHARKAGWLIDALAFESPDEPEGWNKHLHALLDHMILPTDAKESGARSQKSEEKCPECGTGRMLPPVEGKRVCDQCGYVAPMTSDK